MAVVIGQMARPSFWETFRSEIFKTSKQMFYKVLLGVPIAIPLVIMLVQTGIKIFSNKVETGVPSSRTFVSTIELGNEGTFAISNRLMFVQFNSILSIILVVACCLSVANEYRWNTVKMLATRQPSRIKLVLSKCLFALALVVGVGLAMIVGWIMWAMFLKFFYSVSFEITADDWESIGLGLKYFGIVSVQTLVMSLFGIGATWLFKSQVAGIIGYLVYNGLDSLVSAMGAQYGNRALNNIPEWAEPFLKAARDMNPFLISSSTNRLTSLEKITVGSRTLTNPQILASNPIWLAWVVLAVYALLFTALAVAFFTLRDVKD